MDLCPSEIPDDTIKVTDEDFLSRGLKPENPKNLEDDQDESRQEDGNEKQYERGLVDMMGGNCRCHVVFFLDPPVSSNTLTFDTDMSRQA